VRKAQENCTRKRQKEKTIEESAAARGESDVLTLWGPRPDGSLTRLDTRCHISM